MPLRPVDARASLRADCDRCVGLCCVAPAFVASADFALDKPAGQPCPKLGPDCRCTIHPRLREEGFPGCAVFDCFGAGQHVVQVTFGDGDGDGDGGGDWRESAGNAAAMFAVFPVVRQLKELLWYLLEASARLADGPLRDEVSQLQAQTTTLLAAGPETLRRLDPGAHRQQAGALLQRVSRVVRDELPHRAPDRPGADLIGADLRRRDLRGASLRGASLRGAYLLGADLRAADLRGARLDRTLFVVQAQLDAATGDDSTTVPAPLARPGTGLQPLVAYNACLP